MRKILFFLFIGTTIISCQKEADDFGNTGGGTGSGGGTTSSDYQPTSANSELDYTSTMGGNSHTVALGTDTTINGLKYYKFNKIAGGVTERGYISKVNGIYKTYGNFQPVGLVIELTYLKDSAIGTSWTNTITVGGFSNYHKYTVSKREIQHTVNGKSYSSVIEVNYNFLIDDLFGGPPQTAGSGKYYYAKGVGLIESYVNVSFMGVSSSDTARLVSYVIR